MKIIENSNGFVDFIHRTFTQLGFHNSKNVFYDDIIWEEIRKIKITVKAEIIIINDKKKNRSSRRDNRVHVISASSGSHVSKKAPCFFPFGNSSVAGATFTGCVVDSFLFLLHTCIYLSIFKASDLSLSDIGSSSGVWCTLMTRMTNRTDRVDKTRVDAR